MSRKDVRKFRDCAVKGVTFQASRNNEGVVSDRFGATLQCPRKPEGLQTDADNHWSQETALRSLGSIAAKTACHSCNLSGKTITEVNRTLYEEAISGQAALQAQQDYEAAMEAARQDVARIERGIGLNQAQLPDQA